MAAAKDASGVSLAVRMKLTSPDGSRLSSLVSGSKGTGT